MQNKIHTIFFATLWVFVTRCCFAQNENRFSFQNTNLTFDQRVNDLVSRMTPEDLPDFNEYSMNNRTYRYFKGQPLYGFGYGLSYTNFKYDNMRILIPNSGHIMVNTNVTNTGKTDGEEVVELYVSSDGKKEQVPTRALKGFQRLVFKAGESKIIRFSLTNDDLSTVDDKGKPKFLPGKILISVGGCQPDAKSIAAKKTVQDFLN